MSHQLKRINMIKGLINWFRQKTKFILPEHNLVEVQATATTATNKNKTYLIDSSAPSLVIDTLIPTTTLLPMRSSGESGGGYALGTQQQQAMGLKQMINDALVFMASKSPKKLTKWAATSSLTLQARAGTDLNAYYDRSSLKFFYFSDELRKKTVFACDSRAVVTHEFGHALLDMLRPDLWSVMSEEVWAFHESFGDMIAILNNLQYEALIDASLKEVSNDLTKSNMMTRLAADMGIGLYNMTNGKNGELRNCLRDCTQKFTYVAPSTLPKDGRDDQIINESHSFSRIFTGMFYNLLIQVANVYISEKQTPKAALMKARDTMSSYILQASSRAPVTPKFFKAVCQELLVADKSAGGKFQTIMYNTFVSWKIFEPAIKILSKFTYNDVIKTVDSDFEYSDLGSVKVLYTTKMKTIKLSDFHGVLAMQNNPLLSAEVEVAAQSAYYFDENMELQISEEATEAEIIETTMNCISLIQHRNLFGEHDKAQFHMMDGKLVRNKIASCGCNKPNYCIPGAPEYQKPWKPKNNAGCIKCQKSDCSPKSCDCDQPTTTEPPKTGCYASVKTCSTNGYKVGSRISRKVC